MIKLKHECSACGTEFSIQYDEMNTESDPAHCPFCGEFLVLDPDDFGDNDEEDE